MNSDPSSPIDFAEALEHYAKVPDTWTKLRTDGNTENVQLSDSTMNILQGMHACNGQTLWIDKENALASRREIRVRIDP